MLTASTSAKEYVDACRSKLAAQVSAYDRLVAAATGLGARFVFIGRPFLCAAAIAGEQGVGHAVKLLRDQIDRNRALLGIETLAELRELLTTARGPQFLES